MSKYVRVENHPDLVRDKRTGAILNINKDNIRKQRKLLQQRKQEKQEIEQLQNDVSEIKSLLQQLLEKN